MHVFDRDNELGIVDTNPGTATPGLQPGPTFGLRLAYRPRWYIGLEGEAGFTPTSVKEAAALAIFEPFNVKVLSARAHVIFDLIPLEHRFRPFVLAGLGTQTVVASDNVRAVEKDTDLLVHVGAGARFRIGDRFGLRLDGRVLLPPSARSDGFQLSVLDFSATLGGYFTFGAVPVHRPAEVDHVVFAQPELPPPVLAQPPPPMDRDHDGIEDARDQCPAEAKDLDQDRDDDGCPDLDRDGDGVPDATDACILEPETFNQFSDSDGCPDEAAPVVPPVSPTVLGFQFQNGSAKLPRQANTVLEQAAATIAAQPSLR